MRRVTRLEGTFPEVAALLRRKTRETQQRAAVCAVRRAATQLASTHSNVAAALELVDGGGVVDPELYLSLQRLAQDFDERYLHLLDDRLKQSSDERLRFFSDARVVDALIALAADPPRLEDAIYEVLMTENDAEPMTTSLREMLTPAR